MPVPKDHTPDPCHCRCVGHPDSELERLAVGIDTACYLLDIGKTSLYALIDEDRLQPFDLKGPKLLFAQVKALVELESSKALKRAGELDAGIGQLAQRTGRAKRRSSGSGG